jgi:flagella basal body P-ring formation protein FlgA
VLNLQSKRTVSGVVVGRGQVSVAISTPRPAPAADASTTTGANETAAAPVSVAANNAVPGPRKAE